MVKKIALLAAAVAVCLCMTAGAYTGASEWAQEELDKAVSYSLMPEVLSESDVSKPINRLEFAAVGVELYEAFGGTPIENTENPFTDTDNAAVIQAYHAGITTGTSETTFSPEELLSREQAATMLTRIYAMMDKTADLTAVETEKFADDADISDWARESVYFMYAKGIINGIGDNKFAPNNATPEQEQTLYANSTREQALALAVRMYEKLKPEIDKQIGGEKTEDGETTGDEQKDLLAYAPHIDFGTEVDRYSDKYSATLTLKDVTREECLEYVKLMDMSSPNQLYLLDEATQYSKKSTDGTRIMTVSWADGNMSIVVELDLTA